MRLSAGVIITFPSGMCEDDELIRELVNSRMEYRVDADVEVRINGLTVRNVSPPHDANGLRVIHADADLYVRVSFDCTAEDIIAILLGSDLTYYSNDGDHYANTFIVNVKEESDNVQ